MLGIKHSDETKRKLSEKKLLDKNPQWRGGLSFQNYTIERTAKLRESIRERDDYTCRMP